MSGLLNDDEIASLTSDLDAAFQTFVRDIVVWKDPIRVQMSPGQIADGSFGFGGADVSQEEQYIPVSGVFSAVVRYNSIKHIGQAAILQDTNTMIPIGEVKIKVEPKCYDFIENGKTDKISFDNRDWFFVGKAQAIRFLGANYFQYQLKPRP